MIVSIKDCMWVIIITMMCKFSTAITISLTQELYIVAENSTIVQPELMFSNPSYIDTNVTIVTTEINATG